MRFYTNTHNYYCGIDLHAKTMFLCILDGEGKTLHNWRRLHLLKRGLSLFREHREVS